jgi:integrase/recombinase XerD
VPTSSSCAAASVYLGRYRGETRLHTGSDLRLFLRWCADQNLDPLAAVRVDIERYLRWLQDVGRYQPSTVSRRLSVAVGDPFVAVVIDSRSLIHLPTLGRDSLTQVLDAREPEA